MNDGSVVDNTVGHLEHGKLNLKLVTKSQLTCVMRVFHHREARWGRVFLVDESHVNQDIFTLQRVGE